MSIKEILYGNRRLVEEYLRSHRFLSQQLIEALRDRANGHWLAFGQKIGRQTQNKFNGIKRLVEGAAASVTRYIPFSQERDSLASKFHNIREYLGKRLYFNLEHIFEGETYKNGGLGGFHHDYLGYAKSMGSKVIKDITDLGNGFYKALVLDKNGKWVLKSFFPDTWTREQVVETLVNAFDNYKSIESKNGRSVLEAIVSDDLMVRLIIDDDTGKVISAYPFK